MYGGPSKPGEQVLGVQFIDGESIEIRVVGAEKLLVGIERLGFGVQLVDELVDHRVASHHDALACCAARSASRASNSRRLNNRRRDPIGRMG